MDSSSDSDNVPIPINSKRKKSKTLSTSSSSSSGSLGESQKRVLRRRKKRRRREEEIESSSDSDDRLARPPSTPSVLSGLSSSMDGSEEDEIEQGAARPRSFRSRVYFTPGMNLRVFHGEGQGSYISDHVVIRPTERMRPIPRLSQAPTPNQVAREPSGETVSPRQARTVASMRAAPAVEQAAPEAHTPMVAAAAAAADASDSGGEEGGEKCAVCLRHIRSQEIGNPECCDHTFCLVCLVTWSKSCNQCPLDRRPFKLILVRDNLQGPVTRQLAVEERAQPVVFDDVDMSFCMICGDFDREEQMLLCDGCDRGFHIDCLTPPLATVPEVDEWFCPTCEAWQRVTAEMVARAEDRGDVERGEVSTVRLPMHRPLLAEGQNNIRLRPRTPFIFLPRLSLRTSLRLENSRRQDDPTPSPETAAANDGPSTSGTQPSRRPKKRSAKKTTRKVKRRKTVRRRYVTKKKRIFVENDDGTVTEEIVSMKTKVTRRRKRKITKKRKTTRRAATSRSSRSCDAGSSSRGRLERALAAAVATAPSPLIPDVPARRRTTPAVASNLTRFAAGIPTLNIFEPRHELAPVSSGSDDEFGGGEVGLLSRSRGARPRPIERSKAIELLRTAAPRPRIAPQACEGPSDLLSSILESQTIWHSKKSSDAAVEPSSSRVDVRNARPERVATAAPIFPGSGAGTYRPSGDNRTSPSASQSRASAPMAAAPSTSPRGGAINDREGYSNFLSSLSQGPAPFCRGGPPLRIRMPARPQLRRIPLLPRRPRSLYDDEDEGGREEKKGDDLDQTDDAEIGVNDEKTDNCGPKQSEELDLYSDIEPNTERESDAEAVAQYSALGPPPEPPAFLLNLAAGEDKANDKNDSEVYDPAEPCDSEDEMVIDETAAAAAAAAVVVVPPLPPPPQPPAALSDSLIAPIRDRQMIHVCPVLQLYSPDSVAYSQKNEDERAEAIAVEKANRNKFDEVSDAAFAAVAEDVPLELVEDEVVGTEEAKKVADEDKDTAVENSRSPSSSPSRAGSQRSPSFSSSSRRARKDSTHSINSRSSSSFTTKRRKRRSLEKDDSSDDNGNSPVNSSRELPICDSKANDENSPNCQHPRFSTGLEGLEVEEVSSEMEENEFDESRLSSLSLSGISEHSRSSSVTKKKKKKKKRAKMKEKPRKTASEEGEIDSDKEKSKKANKRERKVSNVDGNKRRKSLTRSPSRKVLSSQENKKDEDKEEWKKMPKRNRNYREGRKSSKERPVSIERKRDPSSSPKRDKKLSKYKKKADKKKEIERYDVRKIVKEKEHVRKDAFGRDLPERSASRSRSKSRSRSRSRGRGRPLSRKLSRSPARHVSHSPIRRPARSSRSPTRRRRRRRSRSASRSPLSPRRARRMRRSSDNDGRRGSRPRGRRSPSGSVSPRRRTNLVRGRKSLSRSPSLSPAHRVRDGYSPVRVIRRSVSPVPLRSYVKAWSPTREKSLENLTVVLKSKDKKKRKKKRDERRERKSIDGKRKKSGNSKEVFASGDNVLVSVNFSNKSNKTANNVIIVPDLPLREVSSKKKKKRLANAADDRPSKKNKAVNASAAATKSAVDSALSSDGLAKRKKLGRLTEEDAEEILKRKPVAVIDLDMSPYREQTPSPINVVVVSDSGSGDEGPAGQGKQQRPRSPEVTILPAPAPPTSTGPKTPPEPPLKFSISKPAQIRPIVNPLAEADDDEVEEATVQNESQDATSTEVMHKGPNTPPEPRGPATPPRGPSTPPMKGPNTPRSPQSPQSSPDAYDPFEPTKSRSPSPAELAVDATLENPSAAESATLVVASSVPGEDTVKHTEPTDAVLDTSTVNSIVDVNSNKEKSPIDVVDIVATPCSNFSKVTSARRSTPQPMTPNAATTLQAFSMPSPKTPNRTNSSLPVSGIQRLQHRLGSPVSRTPNSVKSTPEKRTNDTLPLARSKRNGPMPDTTSETVDMDDSPYSPGSSEGDDLFDPPPAVSLPPPALTPHKPIKPKPTTTPVKAPSKFDLLFGPSGPNISPLKNGAKKPTKSIPKTTLPKVTGDKKAVKSAAGTPVKKGVTHRMDEDQLRILDEVPSSAVELQVKDKYLKKLNRQERVVDEVKTVLKPHYAKKHISKEEYKQILRRAVPKICHSKSGEINPSKIQHLVEAYVRKYRQNKKKGSGGVQKTAKLGKSAMFS